MADTLTADVSSLDGITIGDVDGMSHATLVVTMKLLTSFVMVNVESSEFAEMFVDDLRKLVLRALRIFQGMGY